MNAVNIEIAPKLIPVFAPPPGSVRYRALYGGRGSGKSMGAAKVAAVRGATERLRIFCGREFQNSIKESFHAELKAAIESEPFLAAGYDVGVDYLRHTVTGTEFLFKGLRHNIDAAKSTAAVDLTILEEAEDIPERAWMALEATVFRRPNSELWALWNPRKQGSPVDKRFRGENRYKSAIVQELNWQDNPWFPSGLDDLRRENLRSFDPATYAHVWEGAYLLNSEAQVYGGKWEVMAFTPEPDWDGPYHGGDFGFANDPTAAVRVWVDVANNCLMVEYEAGKTKLELDHTAEYISSRIPDFEKHVSRWDSARPESISYLTRHGLPRVQSVSKWPGSVDDGIQHIRSYRRIYVHPRCVNVIKEMTLYSYAVDRLTGDIKPDVVDANNHYLDAVRYAIGPLIKRGKQAGVLLSSNALGGF